MASVNHFSCATRRERASPPGHTRGRTFSLRLKKVKGIYFNGGGNGGTTPGLNCPDAGVFNTPDFGLRFGVNVAGVPAPATSPPTTAPAEPPEPPTAGEGRIVLLLTAAATFPLTAGLTRLGLPFP